MKRNKKGIIALAAFAVIATLASTALVSGTLAKYTGTMTGTGTAKVAKFDFEVNDKKFANDDQSQESFTFSLYDSLSGYPSYFTTDNATELIAPGTKGQFEINVKNTSEVPVNSYLDFTVSGAEVPLNFKYNNATILLNEDRTYTRDKNATTNATPVGIGASQTITVSWEWPWTSDNNNADETDTTLGYAAEDITINATVTVNQVKPPTTTP